MNTKTAFSSKVYQVISFCGSTAKHSLSTHVRSALLLDLNIDPALRFDNDQQHLRQHNTVTERLCSEN